jgi:hypothetical protein
MTFLACCALRACADDNTRKKTETEGAEARGEKKPQDDDLLKDVSEETIENLRFLSAVPLFQDVPDRVFAALGGMCKRFDFRAGDKVVTPGRSLSGLFLVLSGSADITHEEKSTTSPSSCESCSLTAGDFFGEEALFQPMRHSTTITATSPLQILKILRDDFTSQGMNFKCSTPRPLGEAPTWTSKPLSFGPPTGKESSGEATPPPRLSVSSSRSPRQEGILRKDLASLGLLGCGWFGYVELVEHKRSGDTYALKTISRGLLKKHGLSRGPGVEKGIMKMANSRFIVRMHGAYTTPQVTYLLLEPALGGELFTVFHRESFFGKKAHAKYYSAGVALALEHLHGRRIVCRDLKMENVLLDERGHVKLCDMGYAKFVVGKTYTTVGTPEYFAPEMVRGTGHNAALDWWAFGIFIYELLAGVSPFAGQDPVSVARSVLGGPENVYFPEPCQGLAKELLKRLLVTEPTLRLPMQRPLGLQNLQHHAWYSGLDWVALRNGELRPPFEPVVGDNRDVRNFITSEEDKPQLVEHVPSGDDGPADSDQEP